MPVSEGFGLFLAPRLPKGNCLRIYHTSTPPVACPPLFASGLEETTDKTWCETHLLAISQQPISEPTNGPQLLVLALEVLIFTSEDLTTVFVSKADSTGFLLRHPASSNRTSVALATTTAFLEYLVRPRLAARRLVLSLFARSQNQYLFPGSIENETKRILDDRQLIKWWCRVLDPIIRSKFDPAEAATELNTKAYVVVPGCEKTETRAFFPPSARHDSVAEAKWVSEYPVAFLTQDVALPPRCLIPRLPDDPKARFLDDLDGTQVNSDGSWKGVKSLDQFWEMMSYRQECSAGRLVGFIWATFSQSPRSLSLSEAATIDITPDNATTKNIDQFVKDLHQQETLSDPAKPPTWPLSTQGQLILNTEQYTSLMDHLLQLDFAGEETARESTRSWIEQAKKLTGSEQFGTDVEGTFVPEDAQSADINAAPTANLLTAVRKKRKAVPVESNTAAPDIIGNASGLDEGRKKPKT